MKIKNLNKRLILNKKTIATLNRIDMKDVNGGNIVTFFLCTLSCHTVCDFAICMSWDLPHCY
jgi:hypothetical protein